jgi:hypothetical protein
MYKLKAKIAAVISSSLILLAITPGGLCSSLGVKSGDWIEYALQESFSSDRKQRMEFLSVAGTTVSIQVTDQTSGALEINQTETIDPASDDDFSTSFLSARVYIIPSNLGMGDSVFLGNEIGNRTISGETTEAYAGADRRTIYSNFSLNENQYALYWDKQTGVLVEGTMFSGAMYRAVLVTATNMWTGALGWWLWALIAIAIACGIISSRKGFTRMLHRGNSTRRIDDKKTNVNCKMRTTYDPTRLCILDS